MHPSLETPAPGPSGHSGDLTRPKLGFNALLTVRRPPGGGGGFNKIGSLSMHVFETRTATGSERISVLTCLHTTAFALPSIFFPLEMLGVKIWKTPLLWLAKCPLPVGVRVSKTCMLKLPNVCKPGSWSDDLTARAKKKGQQPGFNTKD